MRTGFESMRLGAVIYFLPFFFVLNSSLVLQDTNAAGFLMAFGTAVLGIIFIAGGLQGYLVGAGRLSSGLTGWLTRLPLVIGGILIGWPGIWTSVIGLALSVPVVLGYLVVNRRKPHAIIS